MTKTISAVILTKDEEAAIGACIDSVRDCVGQVYVVDSNSQDATKSIAEARDAIVVPFLWNGRYPKKKQWAIENVPTDDDWLLFLDADERVSPAMASELLELQANGLSGAAYDVELEYYWAGTRLRFGQRVIKRVLLDRTRCSFLPVEDLGAPGGWEVEGHYQPTVDGEVKRLRSLLIHDDPDPLSDWFSRHNRYSDWEAYLRLSASAKAETVRHKSRRGRILEHLPFKPLAVFLNSYVARGGLLDGRAGLDYALALAFYRWQVNAKARAKLVVAGSVREAGAQ